MELTFEKHTSEQSGPDGTHQQLTGAGAGSSAKRRKLDSGAALSIDNSEEAEASLIELEVKDLLADSAVDPHAEAAVLDLVNQVTELINSLPSAEVPPLSAKSFLKHLNFTPEKTFMFHPPTRIQPVGSFPLGAATLPSPALDLALEMPAACFDSKDQLNHRYHAKRALYLAHVAASLRGAAATSYASLCHDPRRPVLVLHPPPGASPSGLTIRIIPVPPPSAFPLQRLAPGRNNLRSAVVAPDTAAPTPPASAPDKQAKAGKGKASAAGKPGSKQAVQQGMEEGVAEAPTPHYNTSVLQDLLVLRQHSDSQAVASRCPRYAAACVLLKVWARCQAVDRGADGWGGPLLPWLLEDLLQKGTASCDMSAMNLFRATLVSLSNPRTFSGGLFMQRVQHTAGGGVAPPDSKAWRRHFPVVFVEASGWLNLAAHVSKAALAQVQQCAKASLQLLNAATPEAFEAVFRSPRPLTSLCDYWHHIRVAGEGEGRYKDALSQDQASWRCGGAKLLACV